MGLRLAAAVMSVLMAPIALSGARNAGADDAAPVPTAAAGAGEQATEADVNAVLARLALVGSDRADRGASARADASAKPGAPKPKPKPERVRPAAGAVTGWYGEWRGSRAHGGVDYDGETGDPVWAAAAGTVVHAGYSPAGYGGYGLLVVINHPTGVQTAYAHLSAVGVALGQTVEAGQQIGAIGSTGFSTGSHLHFEVRVNGLGIDPGLWLGGAVPPV